MGYVLRISYPIRDQKQKALVVALRRRSRLFILRSGIKRYKDKYAEISDITGIAQDRKRMTLTKGADSGKINTEKEFSPRKNNTGSYSVKWDKVQTPEYENKFSQLSDNEKVITSVKTRANWCLNNRDGENTEEIYAISLKNGREIGRITDQAEEYGVVRTKVFDTALTKADEAGEKVILIHNHPRGLPPSISDINVLVKNKNVSGITVGHDGSLYYYTRPNAMIPKNEWDIAISHYDKYSENTSMEKALKILSEKYDFIVKKL